MLSKTEIEQKFSAVEEQGEDVAEKFKKFVQTLDNTLPDGLHKTKLVNALEEASIHAHNALAHAAIVAKNLTHQRAKSGEKPTTTEPQPTPPVTPKVENVPPTS